jgi:hypothetical protein
MELTYAIDYYSSEYEEGRCTAVVSGHNTTVPNEGSGKPIVINATFISRA